MAANTWDLLKSAMDEADSRVQRMRPVRRRIGRVPENIYNKYPPVEFIFEPEIVSIGPHHHGKPRLLPMEVVKKAVAKRFLGRLGHPVKMLHDRVRGVAMKARDLYAELPDHGLTDEEFINMMFFDGCFVLCNIDSRYKDVVIQMMGTDSERSLWSDICVKLENQLPYVVLTALSGLEPADLNRCFNSIYFAIIGDTARHIAPPSVFLFQPHYSLDFLRMHLFGVVEQDSYLRSSNSNLEYPISCMRSATEHTEVGINFKGITGANMRDFQFKSDKCMGGWLSLPTLRLDGLTKKLFLNLIALERRDISGYGVSSYIWFMCQLIRHPEDAKELRSRGVLVSAIGSDQHICDLFKELGKSFLTMDTRYYYIPIADEMEEYYRKKYRRYMVRTIKAHFNVWATNPVALSAATLLLILTLIQTICDVKPLE